MGGQLQSQVTSTFVPWWRLSGGPGGQIKIVAEPDFADVLPEMHPRSAWFSCQHCAHPSFVDSSDVGSICTNRLKFSFNCN